MEYVLIFLYAFSLLLIFLFSLGQLHLTWYYLRAKKNNKQVPVDLDYPMVTIQLPIFNERYVIERLLQSVSEIAYPKDKLEIQVLDDSTDDNI